MKSYDPAVIQFIDQGSQLSMYPGINGGEKKAEPAKAENPHQEDAPAKSTRAKK
jgi:hypothetical protein